MGFNLGFKELNHSDCLEKKIILGQILRNRTGKAHCV